MGARALGVIPVRMDATRLPGKPLLDLQGRTVVQWVHDAAVASGAFDHVLVATPDEDIATEVRRFGGAVAMTRSDHSTGTDRVAEVARQYPDVDVVANIQGDQPFATTEMLSALIAPFSTGAEADMTTLGAPLDLERGLHDPNTVKVVVDRQSYALYFSRAPIPTIRSPLSGVPVYHHVGMYAFSRDYLLYFAGLEPTPLEQCESLEQLRALEHGARIRVSAIAAPTIEINTPEDVERAEQFMSAGCP